MGTKPKAGYRSRVVTSGRHVRLRAAIMAGAFARAIYRVSRRRGDGVHARGLAMMTVDPHAIERLSRGRSSALVTGTNGKTTTTYLLAAALGDHVAHNYTGANMATGIVTAYAESDAPLAAIEVDELHFPSIARMITPRVIVLLNLSRDQLSRSHEVARVVTLWSEALASDGATIVANCADPNVVAATPPERAVWFDPGTRWTDDAHVCPRCAGLIDWTVDSWSCGCGFTMPRPTYRRDGVVLTGPAGDQHDLQLRLPGEFNGGNAVAAIAAASVMGIDIDTALGRMGSLDSAFGRYMSYDVGGRPARLVLAKNPVGMRAALELTGNAQVIVGIGAEGVDGRDTSWLYDAPFDMLAGRLVGAVGRRRHDLALRLEIAGAHPLVGEDIHDVARQLPAGELYLIGNYSNFVLWRRERAWQA